MFNLPETIVDVLQKRASHEPDRRALTYLVDGESEEAHLTYAELDRMARRIAARLSEIGSPGDRVLLFYPSGLDYIAAFFGCLYGGFIAIPSFPPDPYQPQRVLPYFQSILRDSRPKIALTGASVLSLTESLFQKAPELRSLHWVATDSLMSGLTRSQGAMDVRKVSPDQVALLQYTSGSSGVPKGVMLTHGNLMHNNAVIAQKLENSPEAVFVNWIPLHHNMGLIACVTQPVYSGNLGVLLSPASFLQRPVRWLRAITRYRGTTAIGPNFAYDLCSQQIPPEDRYGLDLSTWRIAAFGSEPIRKETLTRFHRTYEPYGFRWESFYPAYGLAEATVMTSAGRPEAAPIVTSVLKSDFEENRIVEKDRSAAVFTCEPDTKELVGCGSPAIDERVAIVRPDSKGVCPEGEVGEVWISGGSVGMGYWNQPEESEKVFRNRLADFPGETFLRTGDLGFLKDGELYVTGRLKEMILIRGKNHYPKDIENTAEKSHSSLRPGSTAAFSVEVGGEERMVIVAEAERRHRSDSRKEPSQLIPIVERRRTAVELAAKAPFSADEVVGAIRKAVAEHHGISAYAILLLKAGSIPKAPNGKIQRTVCRSRFLDGKLDVIGEWRFSPQTVPHEIQRDRTIRGELLAATPEERKWRLVAYLQEKIAGSLGVSAAELDLDGPLNRIGLDSLAGVALKARLEESLGLAVPLATLFENQSLRTLADSLLVRLEDRSPQAWSNASSSREPLHLPRPEERFDPFPLNDIQQAYWMGQSDHFDLGGVSSHLYAEFEFDSIDIDRLQCAWRRVIDRHEMLRAFVLPGGDQQILKAPPPFRIDVTDLRADAEAETAARLERIREEMSHRGPHTDEWPLFEFKASLLKGGRARLHLNISLLIADGWSLKQILRDLERSYEDPETVFEPLTLSFRDYVLATRDMEDADSYRRARQYWWGRLPQLPPAPELPLAKNPSAIRSQRFVRRQGELNPSDWKRFQDLARRAGLTPAGTLCAVYAEILAHWSKEPRFTINVMFFNRLPIHPQVSEVVGNFSSTNLLSVGHAAGDAFGIRAKRIQAQLWSDLEHHQIPGVRVLREYNRIHGVTSQASMPVVFASTLNAKDRETGPIRWLERLAASSIETPQVFLDHQVIEKNEALVYNWDSIDEIFPEGLVADMFEAYEGLLRRLVRSETSWEEGAFFLTPAGQLEERATVNATACPVPPGRLHEPFEIRAEREPQRPAVVDSGRRLTYGEVLSLSIGVARDLRARGVGPNTLVAVVMEKGWEQVVAVLGILQAGAAYLPLDPLLPPERLHFLLDHGQVKVALTQSRLEDRLAWPGQIERLSVDCIQTPTSAAAPLPPAQKPEDLAYVIYTSGSTGVPKGVMIDHVGALNTVTDINRRFGITEDDRVLGLSSLSFDLSVYDIFGILGAGGTVVLPDASSSRDPGHWLEWLRKEKITVWNTVPALLEMLVEYAEAHQETLPASVRIILLSGDWIPVNLPDRIRKVLPEARVISLGGATETSIWSISHPIQRVDPAWKSIPYGRPLANQSFQVFDEGFQPKPVWVPGQLFIGGIGLAKGYWRDEEKSRKSFCRHPRTGDPFYRTGDFGRYLPGGEIEFLGREDFQVKVQGFRIELEEIEKALLLIPKVHAAVVAALGELRGNKRLVAYVVADRSSPVHEKELLSQLRMKLPEYMIPSSVVFLDALPLTSNGKVDRKALPSPDKGRPLLQEAHVTPRDVLELRLTQIWEDLLKTRPVGITDNFFNLGGNSLTAIRLMTEIQKAFGKSLPLLVLLQGPTVERLADLLRKDSGAAASSPLVSIQPSGEGNPFFCVHPVGGNVLCYVGLSRHLEGDRPFYGIQSVGLDGLERPLLSIEDMASRYLREIQRVRPEGPYLLGGWSMGGIVAFEIASQLLAQDQEVALLAMMDSLAPAYFTEVDDATLIAWFARDLGGRMGKDLAWSKEELSGCGSEELLHSLFDQGKQARLFAGDADFDQMRRLYDVFRLNMLAIRRYHPRMTPNRLTLYRATEVFSEDFDSSNDPTLGWGAWTTEAPEVHVLPGDHYTILSEPHVQTLANGLAEAIDKACRRKVVSPSPALRGAGRVSP